MSYESLVAYRIQRAKAMIVEIRPFAEEFIHIVTQQIEN